MSWTSVRRAQLISCCSPQGVRTPLNPHECRYAVDCTRQSEQALSQAYYSYPEGALSLLTGRHKYSCTSSPRVNGCPSGCSEQTYRAGCRRAAWALLSQRQGRLQRRNMQPAKTNSTSSPRMESQNTSFTWSIIFLK